MINKQYETPAEAVADIFDGATILIGGFGAAGSPIELIHALIDQGASDLVVVNNNTGSGHVGLAALIEQGRVAKMICSFPRTAGSTVFPDKYQAGEIDLELVPQGTLAERIRAGGAGIPAFYTPTSVGTGLAEGKEPRISGEREDGVDRRRDRDFAFDECCVERVEYVVDATELVCDRNAALRLDDRFLVFPDGADRFRDVQDGLVNVLFLCHHGFLLLLVCLIIPSRCEDC